ncbi:hypothetical protein Q4E93_03810 [Flavitalea sp. BT771]|uniref:hypothetical protein n=1 Tax=Flavitalea sp. BT771 TaxID=3063329 RepID=UPI0026E3C8FE|nr:hypothetical protein [Flavitalea sp. BT771]MDO6429692.1 hypothetical protein [Flavitalea sp. BT771]MDV6218180.1 hypothetical protein [Flavitalea sp. BT771]
MQQKELLTRTVASVGEEITPQQAADFVNAYAESNPTDVKSYLIGRDIIDQLLAQPGAVGLRFYSALNENRQKTLVYIAVDAEGNDIKKKTVVDPSGNLSVQDALVADRALPGPTTTTIMPSWWPF